MFQRLKNLSASNGKGFLNYFQAWNLSDIFKKASKHLFSLRILRNAGLACRQILKVYLTTIRLILEYSVQVSKNIPAVLSGKLELVQKRALLIIYPSGLAMRTPLVLPSSQASRRGGISHALNTSKNYIIVTM